jgi:hypothetical protein
MIPGEENLAENPSVLQRAEALREVGPVFEGLELRLRVGVIVADVGATVAFDDAEIGE